MLKDKSISFFNNLKRNNLSLFFMQNFVLVLILFLVPTVSIGVLYTNAISKSAKDEIISHNDSQAENFMKVCENVILQSKYVAARIATDKKISPFINMSEEYFEVEEKMRMVGKNNISNNVIDVLNTVAYVTDFIESIYVYSEINDYIITNSGSFKISRLEDNSWHELYERNKESMNMHVDIRRKNKNQYVMSVINPITYINNEVHGVVIVNINLDYFTKYANGSELTCAYDENGIVVICSDIHSVSKNINEIEGLNKDGFTGTKTSDNTSFIYLAKTSDIHYREKVRYTIIYTSALLLFIVMLTVAISIIITRKMVSPLTKISRLLEHPDDISENERIPSELSDMFENILQNISTKSQLEAELEKRIRNLNSHQILSLQAQINPHFLFNTLEIVKIQSVEKLGMNNEIYNMIIKLSVILRACTDINQYFTTIKNEFDIVSNYVDIVNSRYNGRIKLSLDADGLEEVVIIKMLLQPLVENSIIHGLDNGNRLHISITITRTAEKLVAEITDDGIGISPERLAEIKVLLEDGDADLGGESHLGLYNVNRRIKTVYGDRYGLMVTSGGGTKVKITMPNKRN